MSHWPARKLGEVAEIYGGGTPSREVARYWGGDLPWVTPTDLPPVNAGVSVVTATRERLTKDGLAGSSARLLPKGAVLFSSRATIGKVAIAGVPLATNQGFANFVPREGIEPRFLAYSLWRHREDIARLSGSTTFKEVSKGNLGSYEIAVPSLDEQLRVVALFDEAAGLRGRRAAADELMAEFVPALFHQMFGDAASNPMGWPLAPAGELMAACEYGTSKKASADGAGITVLRMGNVTVAGALDLADLKAVELGPDELARQRLRAGDVLFNRTNSRELVGKTGMWDGRFDAVAASYFIRVRLDGNRLLPEYFVTYMNLPHMKRRLREIARGAVGQANINAQELKGLPIPVPPLGLQSEFARLCGEIRGVEGLAQESKVRIDDLGQVLLAQAFPS